MSAEPARPGGRRRRWVVAEVLALVVAPLVAAAAVGAAGLHPSPAPGAPLAAGAGSAVAGAAAAGAAPVDAGRGAGLFGAGLLGAGLLGAGPADAGPDGAVPAGAASTGGATPGPSWSLASSAQPQVPTGALAAVSCPDPASCVAVGAFDDPAGDGVALVETMRAGRWTAVPTPAVPGGSYSYLDAVSCPSPDACVAVGAATLDSGVSMPLAEAFDGSAWRLEAVPLPSGATYGAFDGVSCPTAGSCVAVGADSSATGTGAGLAETRTAGRWQLDSVGGPVGSSYSYLGAVSCPAPGECEAVGAATSAGGRQSTLAEALRGGRWSLDPTPSPVGAPVSLLDAVSCDAAACSAVGDERNAAGSTVPLAERSTGRGWAIEPTAVPHGAQGGFLTALACAGAGRCDAVGFSDGAAGVEVPLDERSVGDAWVAGPISDAEVGTVTGVQEVELAGLACPSGGLCVAVGSATAGSGVQQALAARLSPAGWSALHPADPTGASAALLGAVSCATATSCEAVGYGVSSTGRQVILAEALRGRSWELEPTPTVGVAAALYGVSCPRPGACMAVGYATAADGAEVEVAEERLRTGWIRLPVAPPADATRSALYSVSCTTTVACTAVGDVTDGHGVEHPLVESWDGRRWRAGSVRGPAGPGVAGGGRGGGGGGGGGALYGVSCTTGGCAAVGAVTDAAGEPLAMAGTAADGRWQLSTVPGPRGASSSQLDAVSCPSAGVCTAVGASVVRSGAEVTLVDVLAGGRWRVQPSADPAGATAQGGAGVTCGAASSCTTLYSVSCRGAGSCRAVGAFEDADGEGSAFAEAWGSGHPWRLEDTSVPSGATASDLYGVSCPATGPCAAVGAVIRRSAVKTTLAVVGG